VLDRDRGRAGRLQHVGVGGVDDGIVVPLEVEDLGEPGPEVALRKLDVVKDPVDEGSAVDELLAQRRDVDGEMQVHPGRLADEAENPFKSLLDGRAVRHAFRSVPVLAPRAASIPEAKAGSNALFVTIPGIPGRAGAGEIGGIGHEGPGRVPPLTPGSPSPPRHRHP
jgi:hypothetical protein